MVLIAPWLARGVVSSGCIVYPVEATCLNSLPWRVPAAAVNNEAIGIIRFARWSKGDPQAVVSTWIWLGPWFEQARNNGNTIRVVQLSVVGLLALGLPLRARPAGEPRWTMAWLSIPL